jgi:hypothetical protein
MKDLNVNTFDHNFGVNDSDLFRFEILAQLFFMNNDAK